ncbi:MAG: hypothetical protein QHH17_03435 [Candidatus Bathyarchaeota archaeon]|nr:hypothetical protein [Candidatus Bathyarchaeota archaeon]
MDESVLKPTSFSNRCVHQLKCYWCGEERQFYWVVNFFTILCTIGIIAKDVGRLTAKPIANAKSHFSK